MGMYSLDVGRLNAYQLGFKAVAMCVWCFRSMCNTFDAILCPHPRASYVELLSNPWKNINLFTSGRLQSLRLPLQYCPFKIITICANHVCKERA